MATACAGATQRVEALAIDEANVYCQSQGVRVGTRRRSRLRVAFERIGAPTGSLHIVRERMTAGRLTDADMRFEGLWTTKEGWHRHPLYLPASARPASQIFPTAVIPTFFRQ